MFGKKKKKDLDSAIAAFSEQTAGEPEVMTIEVATDDYLSNVGETEKETTAKIEPKTEEEADNTDAQAIATLSDEEILADAEAEADAAMMAAFEAWLDDSIDNEISREAAKSAMTSVRKSIKAGRFDEALFDVIAKGADYDRAIEEAGQEGEIRGRNARIEELMDDSNRDDGVPHPGANGGEQRRSGGYSIFDLARL